jgi:hypothetical protein
MFILRLSTLLLGFLLIPSSYADIIKKSVSDICHDQSSRYYEKIKNFSAYDTLLSCLDSGGRLPKNKSNSSDKNSSDITLKYSRKVFGHGWSDENKDCQNARMETLIQYSLTTVRFKTTKQCQVISGKWRSPFSGKTIYQASKIDIDHLVPLHWAWQRGAKFWTKKQRIIFANDSANLLAVEASLNRQKSDKGPNKWLPAKNQCQYILRFTRVYQSYQLTPSMQEQKSFNQLKQNLCSKDELQPK